MERIVCLRRESKSRLAEAVERVLEGGAPPPPYMTAPISSSISMLPSVKVKWQCGESFKNIHATTWETLTAFLNLFFKYSTYIPSVNNVHKHKCCIRAKHYTYKLLRLIIVEGSQQFLECSAQFQSFKNFYAWFTFATFAADDRMRHHIYKHYISSLTDLDQHSLTCRIPAALQSTYQTPDILAVTIPLRTQPQYTYHIYNA